MKLKNFRKRLLSSIPGGAHTYSRGYDQYSENVPAILKRGKGAYIYDSQDVAYLDYGMALRAVHLGYAENRINQAVVEQMGNGNNLTLPSIIELEAAELLIDLIDSVDMVKFTKNGSTAVSAAVKLSRAYTGRDKVARCIDHPFFSYDDWFIASTPIKKGIPETDLSKTLTFKYDDITSLENLVDENKSQIACIILEPSNLKHPADSITHEGETFLHDVKRLCKKHGIVFVLDEMITGFRWDIKGAQHYYNIKADLCTFGKAMANGFSVAAVAGKREIMELGSIEFKGRERVFLLSTTHGAEMSGLGAFVETVSFMQDNNVVDHLWDYGRRLVQLINCVAKNYGLSDFIKVSGVECSPVYITLDQDKKPSLAFRTLFVQEMMNKGVLFPWIALSYSHGTVELLKTEIALNSSMSIYKQALENGVAHYLQGKAIQPVFRQFN